jgi:hypothetical protein
MTDSQLASQSWCQAPIGARNQFFFLLDIFLDKVFGLCHSYITSKQAK